MNKNILVTGGYGFIGSALHGGLRYPGDVCNAGELFSACRNVEGIVHLAAVSDKRRFEDDPYRGVQVNLIGLCNVLEAALRYDLWVLFISTYQNTERHLYGLSKLMGEEICVAYQKLGVRIRILRLPIVYGPGSRPDKVVTKIMNELRAGKEPKITTDEKFYFAYVKDVAKIIEGKIPVSKDIGRQHTLPELKETIKKCLVELDHG